MTAQALPAPVIGMRLFEPSPPGLVGREVVGHEPSSRCVWIVLVTGGEPTHPAIE
jgi:hypothetical protein